MGKGYEKETLDVMFDNLTEQLQEHHTEVKERLDKIDIKQGIANGRTSKLEQWMMFVKGGLVVIGALLVPVAVFYINLTISDARKHSDAQQAVMDAFETDEFRDIIKDTIKSCVEDTTCAIIEND